ncbi:hypothetical protein BSKO_10899 [Bryopsis sp. KO-2023]|nr:hypothetical protein BSKO_10899 [Bryopsis sp. KO-2023]
MGDEFSFSPLPSLAVPDLSALNSRVRESALAERKSIAAELRAWKLDRREQALNKRSSGLQGWYQECCEWHASTIAKQDRKQKHNEAEAAKWEKQREELDSREAALAAQKPVHDVCVQTAPSVVAVEVQTPPPVSVAPIGVQSSDDAVIASSVGTQTAPVGLGKDDEGDKKKVEVGLATSEEKARTQEKTTITEKTTTPAARKKKTSKRGRDGNDDVSSSKYFLSFMLCLMLAGWKTYVCMDRVG